MLLLRNFKKKYVLFCPIILGFLITEVFTHVRRVAAF